MPELRQEESFEFIIIQNEPDEQEKDESLVLYTGDIYSLFVHPLIADPEKVPKIAGKKYMYDWFVTADEFRRMIEELYKNNFILIRTDDIYTWDSELQKPQKKNLLLPAGKKPLLFSIDDLNYYQTMQDGGTNTRLAFSETGQLEAQMVSPDGVIKNNRDEAVFILEDFTALYPDFSLNGAKGTIALTGYNGLFGYTIWDRQISAFTESFSTARDIADSLKQSGWEFASHGYSHLHTDQISAQMLVQDCLFWHAIIEPVVGQTYIYILPFGEEPVHYPEHWQILQQFEFRIIFGVGAGTMSHWKNTCLLIRRRAIDGIFYKSAGTGSEVFFLKEKVFNPAERSSMLAPPVPAYS